MLRVLFAPAIALMSRLSFPMKFGLVCAMFAIPLTITTVQSVLDQRQQLLAGQNQLKGIAHIKSFQMILNDVEHFRDLSVINRARSNSKIVGYLNALKNNLHNALTHYIEHQELDHNEVLKKDAERLLYTLENFQSSTGSEADYLYNVFDNVDELSQMAYQLQARMAKEYGLLSGKDLGANQVTNVLMDDFHPIMRELGKARAYGTYFLSVKVLDSVGITLAEDIYQDLGSAGNNLIERLALIKLTDTVEGSGNIVDVNILDKIEQTRNLVEEQILLDPDLITPWESYYLSLTDTVRDVNNLRAGLVSWLELHYRFKVKDLNKNSNFYVIGLATLICLFAYLYYGFYLAFRNGFTDLSSAANRVAEGELDRPVPKRSNDELGELSETLDTMREQLKEREEELLRLATTDALTNVNNRLYFNDSIHRHVERLHESKSTLSLLLIDIDHFKLLNDRYGHLAGDYCLKEVAKCLNDSLVRQQDEVARYGGEEFAVILPATDLNGAIRIAQMLCENIRNLKLNFNGELIQTSISLGVSSSSDFRECREDDLLSRADKALYVAKENGRDQWAHINEGKIHLAQANER